MDSTSDRFENPYSLFKLEVKRTTQRPKSSAPAWPDFTSRAYRGILAVPSTDSAWGEDALHSFTHMELVLWKGALLLNWSGCNGRLSISTLQDSIRQGHNSQQTKY